MVRTKENIDLFGYNSFHVHASALRVVEFDRECEAEEAFSGISGQWMALGGGNNVLFTRPVEQTIVIPCNTEIKVVSESDSAISVRAGAGVEWDDFVEWTVARDLWGAENLSLIPGHVGASPVQNIGAYGAEASDIISRVNMYCPAEHNTLSLAAEHCSFAYRESIFKHALKGRVVITSVEFTLSRIPRPKLDYGDVLREVEQRGGATLRNIRDAVIAIRRRKLPDPSVTGNAGSFFKNPVVERQVLDSMLAMYPDMPYYPLDSGKVKLAAGWLIDKAGLKGYSNGHVGVHPTQALVLVNCGDATGSDVLEFAHFISDEVEEKFGIVISPEVNIL